MMVLSNGELNITYTVSDIKTNDESMKEFLFSLGCYPGENIIIISKLASNFIINVKDARYSIDTELANVIEIEE